MTWEGIFMALVFVAGLLSIFMAAAWFGEKYL